MANFSRVLHISGKEFAGQVRRAQTRRVHPLSREASQEGRRCRTALVTNNYLAGMGHPPWLGNIPERRFMVFGDQQPFSDSNPKVIDGQHWRCSIK